MVQSALKPQAAPALQAAELATALPAVAPKRSFSVMTLLASGGDNRIQLDESTGLNRYGCQAFPDEGARAFGSSTASVISVNGYAGAERLAGRLSEATLQGADPAALYADGLDRVRAELSRLLGLEPGVRALIGQSGTDLHRVLAILTGLGERSAPLVIASEPAESGSGVGEALGGLTSAGGALRAHLAALRAPAAPMPCQILPAPSRGPDGAPRSCEAVDQDVAAVASAAAALGRRVVLVLMDVSKTGLISPSVDCALDLKRRYPERVEVLVDACQMRLSPQSIRAYLAADFMVAVTGSKFMTGPTFSAALLIPEDAAARLSAHHLPSSLAAHTTRADWPEGWNGAQALPAGANFGLLLRWQAALEEMEPFLALQPDQIEAFFQAFAMAAQARMDHDGAFQPLAQRPLDRSGVGTPAGWDKVQTIHPFLLMGPSGPLGAEDTLGLYRLMAMDLGGWARAVGEAPVRQAAAQARVQLGQPVGCGQRDGRGLSALRLCASARLAVDALGPTGRGPQAVIDDALLALDKAAWLCRRMTSAT